MYARSGSGILHLAFPVHNVFFCLLFKRALPRSTSFRACIQKSFVVFDVIPGLHSKELCRVLRRSGLAFKRALLCLTSFRACIQKSLAAFNFVPRLLFKRALLCLTSFRACIQKSFVVFNVIPGLTRNLTFRRLYFVIAYDFVLLRTNYNPL